MYKFVVYRDSVGLWCWYYISPTGSKLADGGQGYKDRQECLDAIRSIKVKAPTAPFVEI